MGEHHPAVTPEQAQAVAERAAQAMWANDRASKALGMRIDAVAPGVATLSMTVRADMLNGHDICHGGFIFTLSDSAFAFACNSYNLVTVASGCSIEFLAPARGGDVLTAHAHERSASGHDFSDPPRERRPHPGQRSDSTWVGHERGPLMDGRGPGAPWGQG